MYFIKQHKEIIIIILLLFGFLVGTKIIASGISLEIEQAGGVQQIVIDAGKGIKDIVHEISEHDPD